MLTFKIEVNMRLGQHDFLKVLFLTFLAKHTKRKKCGQMGPTPCYLQGQVVSACQSFRPVAPSFFNFFLIFNFFIFYNIDILMVFLY